MSTLSSSSTLAEIKDAYLDNGSYEEDDSTTKAAAFITACRLLLIKLPKKAVKSAAEVELEPGLIKAELTSARRWLATKGAVGGGVTHVDMRGFRD